MDSKQVGELGEQIARDYLEERGYKILDRNYKEQVKFGPGFGEIDIIAKNKDVIVFVEVKTLRQTNSEIFEPEDRVNFYKQRKLVKLAELWLSKKKIPLDTKWQIDVVSIKLNLALRKAEINYFENVVGDR